MNLIPHTDPLASAVTSAIQKGDTDKLQSLLNEHPQRAASSINFPAEKVQRSMLHIATDWPGHFPNVADTIRMLLKAGANVNACIKGPNTETPLHWAASSNDVAAIDALIDGGADLNAQGAVIAGGDPLEDAIGFQNWDAARRLADRGATTKLGDEAALGLMDRIRPRFESEQSPTSGSITYSFWNACCAGQLQAAQFLLEKGADLNWVPEWCDESPLDGAVKSGNPDLITWLVSLDAKRNAS